MQVGTIRGDKRFQFGKGRVFAESVNHQRAVTPGADPFESGALGAGALLREYLPLRGDYPPTEREPIDAVHVTQYR